MSRDDLTHAIRLRQRRADYKRAGRNFDVDEIARCATTAGTADFTRAEVERLLRDEDGTQAERQAETLARHEGR
jgi:hypothetical protein